jgi:hypothetical protein
MKPENTPSAPLPESYTVVRVKHTMPPLYRIEGRPIAGIDGPMQLGTGTGVRSRPVWTEFTLNAAGFVASSRGEDLRVWSPVFELFHSTYGEWYRPTAIGWHALRAADLAVAPEESKVDLATLCQARSPADLAADVSRVLLLLGVEGRTRSDYDALLRGYAALGSPIAKAVLNRSPELPPPGGEGPLPNTQQRHEPHPDTCLPSCGGGPHPHESPPSHRPEPREAASGQLHLAQDAADPGGEEPPRAEDAPPIVSGTTTKTAESAAARVLLAATPTITRLAEARSVRYRIEGAGTEFTLLRQGPQPDHIVTWYGQGPENWRTLVETRSPEHEFRVPYLWLTEAGRAALREADARAVSRTEPRVSPPSAAPVAPQAANAMLGQLRRPRDGEPGLYLAVSVSPPRILDLDDELRSIPWGAFLNAEPLPGAEVERLFERRCAEWERRASELRQELVCAEGRVAEATITRLLVRRLCAPAHADKPIHAPLEEEAALALPTAPGAVPPDAIDRVLDRCRNRLDAIDRILGGRDNEVPEQTAARVVAERDRALAEVDRLQALVEANGGGDPPDDQRRRNRSTPPPPADAACVAEDLRLDFCLSAARWCGGRDPKARERARDLLARLRKDYPPSPDIEGLAALLDGPFNPVPEIDAEVRADLADARASDAAAGIREGWHPGGPSRADGSGSQDATPAAVSSVTRAGEREPSLKTGEAVQEVGARAGNKPIHGGLLGNVHDMCATKAMASALALPTPPGTVPASGAAPTITRLSGRDRHRPPIIRVLPSGTTVTFARAKASPSRGSEGAITRHAALIGEPIHPDPAIDAWLRSSARAGHIAMVHLGGSPCENGCDRSPVQLHADGRAITLGDRLLAYAQRVAIDGDHEDLRAAIELMSGYPATVAADLGCEPSELLLWCAGALTSCAPASDQDPLGEAAAEGGDIDAAGRASSTAAEAHTIDDGGDADRVSPTAADLEALSISLGERLLAHAQAVARNRRVLGAPSSFAATAESLKLCAVRVAADLGCDPDDVRLWCAGALAAVQETKRVAAEAVVAADCDHEKDSSIFEEPPVAQQVQEATDRLLARIDRAIDALRPEPPRPTAAELRERVADAQRLVALYSDRPPAAVRDYLAMAQANLEAALREEADGTPQEREAEAEARERDVASTESLLAQLERVRAALRSS